MKCLRMVVLVGVVLALLAACAPAYPEPTATPTPALPAEFQPSFGCNARIIEQPFERGRMYWLGRSQDQRCATVPDFTPGAGEIWVLFYDGGNLSGRWARYVDDWDETTMPESDPELLPPDGLIQPVRGFGHVWRNKLTEAERELIGWATLSEWPIVTVYQYISEGYTDPDGEFVPVPGEHHFDDLGGNAVLIFEEPQTFRIVVVNPTPTPAPAATATPDPTALTETAAPTPSPTP